MDELSRQLRDAQGEQRMSEDLEDASNLGPQAHRPASELTGLEVPEGTPTIDLNLPPVGTPAPKGPRWRRSMIISTAARHGLVKLPPK